ncbi:TIGR04551 family protein [Persicimonas caeni]|uniref:TIGR04551 family protein n=1 Tax=Persicimonas caeni TaxID=2292766 RepID=A0A4Y6PNS8_PERCE|nr:TIGR04551 family protein [Persicimonas caeni]QDG49910.1 TIGR04551 family protein [Persicimonas caeni]QED31131.1 TIGR04551 family protein [Persicimonas caeni]
MDSSLIFRSLLTALLVCAGTSSALAQQAPGDEPAAEEQPEEEADAPSDEQAQPAEADEPEQEEADQAAEQQEQEQPAAPDTGEQAQPAGEGEADEDETGEQEDAAPEAAEPPPAQPVQPAEQPQQIEAPEPSEDAQESPISDLANGDADEEFVPLEDIEEGVLESITPAEVYPYVDWNGYFRLRSEVNVGFDLDTGGTSAVPPPVDEFVSPNPETTDPVEEEADTLWTTDMRLRLEPTINITEALRLHIEADIFDNVVLGTQYDNPDFFGVANGVEDRPPVIRVNEAWGEVDAFFGTLRAGRMDDPWGLGIFSDSGDCLDCSVENPIDRVAFTTQIWEVYTRLTVDFPSEGLTTEPLLFAGQAYDIGQADDVDQYTISIFRKPVTREDRELQAHRLEVEKKPVFNGGVYFTYRNQSGFFSPSTAAGQDVGETEALDQGLLVYRGMELYVPDVWFEMLYNPEPDMLVRLALEGVGVFGSVDNSTREAVGVTDNDQSVNCFDDDERSNNEQVCSSQGTGAERESVSKDITEFGLALESELYFGGPVRFGLNGGFATGGPEANWGFTVDNNGNIVPANGAGLDFYRFNPNYHVDLILFREVIGTVTNAYYGNPWAQIRFLETPSSRMELQFDAIVSAAMDSAGTPSAIIEDGESVEGNSMLGLELDAATRYIETDHFRAEIEGGILFPFSGLGARTGGRRLVPVGDDPVDIGANVDPSIAWTVQGNLFWTF